MTSTSRTVPDSTENAWNKSSQKMDITVWDTEQETARGQFRTPHERHRYKRILITVFTSQGRLSTMCTLQEKQIYLMTDKSGLRVNHWLEHGSAARISPDNGDPTTAWLELHDEWKELIETPVMKNVQSQISWNWCRVD
jgi:hypothetical protein